MPPAHPAGQIAPLKIEGRTLRGLGNGAFDPQTLVPLDTAFDEAVLLPIDLSVNHICQETVG
jgi:hypothetical protein